MISHSEQGEVWSGPVTPLIIVSNASNLDRNANLSPKHKQARHISVAADTIAVIFSSRDNMRGYKRLTHACDHFLIVHHDHDNEIPARVWLIGLIRHCFDEEMFYSIEDRGKEKHIS